MKRRHAFRPAAVGPLEGRLAPASIAPSGLVAPASISSASIYASNVDSTAAHQARVAQQAHARAVARANAHSNDTFHINWTKLGNQLKDTFGLNHHSSSSKAAPTPVRTTNNAFRRF